jgi:hypothetical protein
MRWTATKGHEMDGNKWTLDGRHQRDMRWTVTKGHEMDCKKGHEMDGNKGTLDGQQQRDMRWMATNHRNIFMNNFQV